jgi:hypothetical protein
MPDSLAKVEFAEGPRPRRYVAACLVAAAALLGAVVAANVVVNPRAEFPGEAYRPLVEDIPREKLALYRDAAPAGTILVGSSRAMPLPPAATGDATAFNFAILGGSLRDDRLAYELVRREQGPPQRLVVGLDTFQLMDLPDGRLWSEVLSSSAASQYAGGPLPAGRYLGPLHDTLSIGYLEDTVRALRYTYVDGYPDPANAFLANGQGVRQVDDEVAAGTYDLDAAFEANWQRYLGNIYSPTSTASPTQLQELRNLVTRASADGAEVQVVLPPFYGKALDRLEAVEGFVRLHDQAREAMLALCAPGVSFVDATEVEAFGGDPTGFYDGYHVTPANGALLLEAMGDGRGDECGS